MPVQLTLIFMFFTCIPSKEIAANFDLFEANAMLKQLMQF